MQKKKKGLLLFISSLIPGAGEMYLGFKKQGISIMLLFFLIFAIGAGTGLDLLILFAPIIWFYSFYNVHNLKSLSDEEFYALEDNYVLHLDEFIGEAGTFFQKYHFATAILLTILGVSIIWRGVSDILYWIIPESLANMFNTFGYNLPQIVIGIFILAAGLYLLNNKKHDSDDYYQESEYHWEPYPPYQQPETPAPEQAQNITPVSTEPQEEPAQEPQETPVDTEASSQQIQEQ